MTGHAIQRAKERYGPDLTAADLAEIMGRIEGGGALIWRRSAKSEIWIVPHASTMLVAVVRSGQITTFFPRDHCKSGTGKRIYGQRKRRRHQCQQ